MINSNLCKDLVLSYWAIAWSYGVDVRDVRVDFFRGLALFMILVDHVVADPISRFTYQKYGFSDAAEIFVFLSGVSCGIVYSKVLARRGWTGFMAAITRRAVLIYALLPIIQHHNFCSLKLLPLRSKMPA